VASVALERRTGSLPAEMTRFIGRKHDLADLKRLLEASRLVTVAGVGGVGKTRLALRVAGDLKRSFADGIWFAELSGVRDAGLVPQAVAEALGLSDQSARDRVDLLAEHLADKQLLLILDTCEHLVGACAMLAEVLLRSAPGLRVLTTSQQPLDVSGEHTLFLAPLPVPDPDDPLSASGNYDALALFADRATAVVPGFVIEDGNRQAVTRLCHRLDGIPLALELAAVRLRVLSLEQITERLDDRFRLLGTARTALSRHQTLRAAVEWSHELCAPGERVLWARLSVFAGDFDLAAAEEVCADDDLPKEVVLETLAGLVERSIVLRTHHSAGGRYRMLDTIREYGAESLERAGLRADMRKRHFRYFRGLAEQAERRSFSGDQVEWILRLQRDYADLRAALEYAAQPEVPAADALSLAARLNHFWVVGGRFAEGRLWTGRVLAAHPEPVPERLFAVCSASVLATLQGDLDAARPLAAEAEALADSAGDERSRRYAEGVVGMIAFSENSIKGIKKHWEEPPLWAGDIANPDVWSVTRLAMLGGAYCMAGDLDQAMAYATACTDLCTRSGERWCLSYGLYVQGACAMLRGDVAGGTALVRQSLQIKRGFNDHLGIAMCSDVLGGCAIFEERPERAARLFGGARRIWRSLGAPMFGEGYASVHDMGEDMVRQALGEDAFAAEYAAGARLDTASLVAYALEEEADLGPSTARDPWAPLTKRERDIAGLVADGLSNREIAERLVIAKRTVETHVEHILAKLSFSSRAQIAAWVAERRG
jgi:predicted ATPase/DNA-binding CsgD family transcriptional regulator